MKNAWFFLTKLARLSRHSSEKERHQSETLFCVLQTSIVKTSIVGNIEILCLKIDMTCKIENGFYTRLFSLRIFQDTKTQKCGFSNKMACLSRHSFKRRCIHTETLLSEIGIGFY